MRVRIRRRIQHGTSVHTTSTGPQHNRCASHTLEFQFARQRAACQEPSGTSLASSRCLIRSPSESSMARSRTTRARKSLYAVLCCRAWQRLALSALALAPAPTWHWAPGRALTSHAVARLNDVSYFEICRPHACVLCTGMRSETMGEVYSSLSDRVLGTDDCVQRSLVPTRYDKDRPH